MDTEERLELALISFIERVSKGEATSAETQALPEAASVLERLLEMY